MPLDPESIRLIKQRQRAAGWVAPHMRAMTSLGAAPSQAFDALANMRTNAQARGVLGIAAKYLRQAYGILDTFTAWPTGTTKESARELLDRTNRYAQQIYAKLPNNTAVIDPVVRKQVVVAANQAATNLQLVSSVRDNLNQDFLTDLVDYLNAGVGHVIDDVIDRVTGKKKTEIGRVLIWCALGTVGLGIAYVGFRLVRTAVLGGAALEEAEAAAIAIAEATDRQKRSKRFVTIT